MMTSATVCMLLTLTKLSLFALCDGDQLLDVYITAKHIAYTLLAKHATQPLAAIATSRRLLAVSGWRLADAWRGAKHDGWWWWWW